MTSSSNRRAAITLVAALLSSAALSQTAFADSAACAASQQAAIPVVHYRTVKVDGVDIFYREAGPPERRLCSCCTGFRPRPTCSAT